MGRDHARRLLRALSAPGRLGADLFPGGRAGGLGVGVPSAPHQAHTGGVRFTPGGDEFPSPCLFCTHTRNAEGICQCPPDCATCAAGRQGPLSVSCCGRVVTVEVRITPLGAEPDLNHPRALLTRWAVEAADMNAKRVACEADGLEVEAAIFRSRAATLTECAEQLRNRLLWSGL